MQWTGLLAAVALGGACGATGRFLISEMLRIFTNWPAYAGTLAANLIGCLGIGLAFGYVESADRAPWVKALLVTGLLGAFTTFSTFSLDAMHLIADRRYFELIGYMGGSVLVGLAAVKLGMLLMAGLVR